MPARHRRRPRERLLLKDLIFINGWRRATVVQGYIIGFSIKELQAKAEEWSELKQGEIGGEAGDVCASVIRVFPLCRVSDGEIPITAENIRATLAKFASQTMVSPLDSWLKELDAEITEIKKTL